MTRRFIAALLALMMLAAAAWAEETADEAPEVTSLVVGNTTPMRGEFFTEMWGNATSDIDVRDLLHAYNLIRWDGENGMFTVDPSVVSGVVETRNEAGDHTYTMVLYDDLFYSDGSRITAWDYAFSYLFSISPVLSDLGAAPLRREQIVGWKEYTEGGAPLSGVRVLSDDTLSVTISHEYLPFFYEMGLLRCSPYPISVIAPGVTVRDDGNGVYLSNEDPGVTAPLFTAELLRSTILDPDTGYQSHPSVTSGPYVLTSWDGVTAEFEMNPYYKGNDRGERPSITHLTYTLAANDTMMAQLGEGEFDLLNKVTRADSVAAGLALSDTAMSNYPRVGLSYISFACERPTVSSQAVRNAIAYCFDREAVTASYTGGFGMRVDGYYGIGQWMYGIMAGTTPYPIEEPEAEEGEREPSAEAVAKYEAALAAYEALSLDGLNPYGVDTARAAALLEADGWRINPEGLREKDGVVLDLRLIYPEGNNVYEALQASLVEPLSTVGIRLSLEAVPMGELLNRWYKQGEHSERDDDMIYLASNFDLVFDPSAHFNADGAWSYTNLKDEALYSAAVAMRTTEPGDVLTYLQHWVAFEERFNEALPMIPVYSNIYFDFYRDDLQNYAIGESVSWAQAIVGAWIGEEEAAEGEEIFED